MLPPPFCILVSVHSSPCSSLLYSHILNLAGRRRSLHFPADFFDIEIERAHSPVPSWRHTGGSPTRELVRSPPARQHSGEGGLVILKRERGHDVGHLSYTRASSLGNTPMGSGAIESWDDVSKGPGAALSKLCDAAGEGCPQIPFRCMDSRSRRKGNRAGEAEAGGADSCSSADRAQRIAVDPDTGRSYFVERATVCDACTCCDDVCEVIWCSCCNERRAQLEHSFGPLLESERDNRTQNRSINSSSSSGSGVSSNTSPSTMVYWGRAGKGDDPDDDGVTMPGCHRNSSGWASSMPPSLSARYSRKAGYTLCEVRRRKLTGACWVVVQGSVYDVTSALEDHPGGKRSVLRNAGGRDCEEDFLFHSKAAKKRWRQYRIGHLVDCVGENGGDGSRTQRISSTECVVS